MRRVDLPDTVKVHNRDHVISIFEGFEIQTDGDPTPEGVKYHAKFYFNDHKTVNSSSNYAPTIYDVRDILDTYDWLVDKKTLVHCYAGISRASAAVFALYCKDLGPGKEAEAMIKTYASAPYKGIDPNPLIVAFADDILEREGKMITALNEWRKTQINVETGLIIP